MLRGILKSHRHLLWIAIAFPLLLVGPLLAATPTELKEAGEVHDLAGSLAEKHIPVHLVATVTYYEPSDPTLFVADASGGVYVKTSHPYPIHRGDLVKIDGVTDKSFKTTVGLDPVIQVIGKGSFTRAKIRNFRSYEELMGGRWDCQYVVMDGLVRSALYEDPNDTRILELEIVMPGGIVQSYVENSKGLDPAALIDAQVELSGVVGGDFNAQWQLMRSIVYAADATDLRIIRKPAIRRSSLPLTDIDRVMQTHSVNDLTERVRVRGAVTSYQPGSSVVVQQGGRSLYASTRQADPIPLGAVVDLVGFAAEGGYSPALGQAQIFPTGQTETVSPVVVNYAQAMSGVYSDNLISLSGRIISQLHTDASDTLLIGVDDHAVTAVLQTRKGIERLPNLRIGAVVSVVGICRITPTSIWEGIGASPVLFHLDMRTAQDLRVLSSPSWWTVTHLLFVVGALIGLSLLTASWAAVLRRRVAQQTAMIEQTVRLEKARSKLLEAIKSETLLEPLLKDIRTSLECLSPGLSCSYQIADDHDSRKSSDQSKCIGEPLEEVLFETPLTDGLGRHIGSFYGGCAKKRTLSPHESEVLAVHAGLANLAMNQTRIYQELNYTSTHDQLTGLPNRRLSDLCFDDALKEAIRTGGHVGVAYIDVDRFKQVNDEHGHRIGDLYLRQLASRLSSQVRNSDKLARIGGDEFLLVATAMRGIAEMDAYRSRLESCFEESFTLDGTCIFGAASIGIAIYPDHGSNAEELKRHADSDMYAAKRHKRDGNSFSSTLRIETTIPAA